MKSIKWLLKNIKKEIRIVVLLCIINALISLCVIGFAYMTIRVIDTAQGIIDSSLFYEFLKLFILITFRIILGIINNRLMVISTAKLTIRLQKNIFTNFLTKRYNKISTIHSGDILNRLTSDVEIVTSAFVNIPVNFVAMASKVIFGLIVMVIIEPLFALAFFIIGTIIFTISRFFSSRFKKIHKASQDVLGKIRGLIAEVIQNISVVKSYNGREKIENDLEKKYEKSIKLQLKKNLISTISSMGNYSLITYSYYIALSIGAIRLSQGTLTVGVLMGFLQLINQIQMPFRSMSGVFSQFYSALASLERLIETDNIENEPEITSCVEEFNEITFNGVSFYYKTDLIFDDASLKINKGDFLALMGPSGIGKSTITKLLLSLEEPTQGTILVDGIPLGQEHRSLFAYVPQGNLILSGTIKENIIFCSSVDDDKRLLEALTVSQSMEFVNSLPKGINTIIGEKGYGLSEGQIQRLSIARAIYADRKILLLDEATSALDVDTEKKIIEGILLLNKTIISISHKDTAIKFCNRILQIQNKKLFEVEKNIDKEISR